MILTIWAHKVTPGHQSSIVKGTINVLLIGILNMQLIIAIVILIPI